jgi:hypothetical protein
MKYANAVLMRRRRSCPLTKSRYSSMVKSLGSEFSSIRMRRIEPSYFFGIKWGWKLIHYLGTSEAYCAFIITTSRSGHCPINVADPPEYLKIFHSFWDLCQVLSHLRLQIVFFISTAKVILKSLDKKIFIE